jgi:NarL family two-component system response regulator YdfI
LCGSVIRVFIVGASSLVRAGLQSLLGARNVEIVGNIANFEALAGQWPDVEADVVLVDVSGDQFEAVIDSLAASQLAAEANIVILADHFEPRWFAEALRAGVCAVLPGDISQDQLVAALEAAAAGLIVMHPTEVGAMFPAAESASRPFAELAEPLTPRESEVLQMLASGLANKEIAARLAISDHTVKFHVASILGKLGAGSRTEAVSLGIRRGLVLL